VTNTLLTLAFTAGLLAPVNPCGFALLPAYLTHTAATRPGAALPQRLVRSLAAGAALAAGFALTLSAAGLAISAGAHQLIRAAPWLGFTVGVLLALLGLAGLAGRGPRMRLRLPTFRPRTSGGTASPGRWALFGVGYAAASLACTIAVLLAVITQAQASTTIAGQVVVFGAYAAGSIALLLVLSAAAALAGSALSRWARALARHQARITAALLLLTGGYVAAYWWPAITGHSPTGHGLAAIDRWSATTATWLQAHTSTVAAAALALIIVTAAAAITARWRRRSQTRTTATTHTPAAAQPDDHEAQPARDDHSAAPHPRSGTATQPAAHPLQWRPSRPRWVTFSAQLVRVHRRPLG
jgi:cytochrome c-type biogenesis protein